MTLYLILWTTIVSSLCILFLHTMLKKTDYLIRFGVGFFALCAILCLLRLLTPVEFLPFQHKIELPYAISLLIPRQHIFHSDTLLLYLLAGIASIVAIWKMIPFYSELSDSLRRMKETSVEYQPGQEILYEIDPDCKLPVRICPSIHSPLVAGYLHPAIYLPNISYKREYLLNILRHEYTHWKHHHLTIKLVLHTLTLLLWWVPFITTLEKDISHILELMCDEYTSRNWNMEGKLSYLGTIIYCLKQARNSEAPLEADISPVHLNFAADATGILTNQRFSYHLNRERTHSLKQNLLMAALSFGVILLLASSYYFIIQPVYQPEDVESYSNENNAYLVELADGSYEFHFEEYADEISKEEVESGDYYIYTIIPYEEYKDLGDYTQSQTYQELFY